MKNIWYDTYSISSLESWIRPWFHGFGSSQETLSQYRMLVMRHAHVKAVSSGTMSFFWVLSQTTSCDRGDLKRFLERITGVDLLTTYKILGWQHFTVDLLTNKKNDVELIEVWKVAPRELYHSLFFFWAKNSSISFILFWHQTNLLLRPSSSTQCHHLLRRCREVSPWVNLWSPWIWVEICKYGFDDISEFLYIFFFDWHTQIYLCSNFQIISFIIIFNMVSLWIRVSNFALNKCSGIELTENWFVNSQTKV